SCCEDGTRKNETDQRKEGADRAGDAESDQDDEPKNVDARCDLADAQIARKVIIREPSMLLDPHTPDEIGRGRTTSKRLNADERPDPQKPPGRNHDYRLSFSGPFSYTIPMARY